MIATGQITFAERVGRMLGRAWRECVRLDQRANGWLLGRGWAAHRVKGVLVAIKLAVVGVLLYAAFWLAVLLMLVAFAAWAVKDSERDESEEWAIGDQAEHKRSVFYDPINYSDDPDPRFDDER